MESKKHKFKLLGVKDLPSYLLEKDNVVRIILFTTAFSLLFINIFRPFNSENWIPNINRFNYFMYSSLMVITGMIVVSISRVIMHFFTKKYQIGFLEYITWAVAETVLISAFYVFIAFYVGFVDNYMAENPNINIWEALFNIFRSSIANTVCMLFIPYSIALLYLENEHLKKTIELMKQENNKSNIINFKDDRGEIRFSITLNNIYYLESSDNYVIIKYLNNNKIEDYILRSNLKKVSEELKDTPIQRCHRSFMVNIMHIASLMKDPNEITIQFDNPSIKNIYVSKTYQDTIVDSFSKYQR
ncbi:MAG: LytR/AlgR family response regulator transcription factor [Candidatus Limimorpha sp.]